VAHSAHLTLDELTRGMNAHVLHHIARTRTRWPLAGDNLVVDLYVSRESLPPGTRLAIGTAVIEISEKTHRGCAKFSARFREAPREFVNRGDFIQRT